MPALGGETIKDLWPKIKNWDSIQEKMAGENDNAEYAHNTDQLRNRAKENKEQIEDKIVSKEVL